MEEDVKVNRIILLMTLILLLVLGGFFLKFYFDQKKENASLRVKLLTLTQNKRIITPLKQLITKPPLLAAPKNSTVTGNQNNISADETAENIPLPDRPIEEIANELTLKMSNAQAASVNDLDRSITLADELLSREPSSYSAYKAKLIALLIKEGKYNQEASDSEVNELLETMAEFDVTSDKVARQEAALLSNANNQLLDLEETVRSIAEERIGIESTLANFEPGSVEYVQLEQQREELFQREQQINAQLIQFENTIQTAITDDAYLNEDIVEIPFMRSMAREDYESVEEEAQAFIEQFPTSISGYYFLVKSLDAQGRQDEANDIMANAQLSPEAQKTLLDRVEQNRFKDPKEYWRRLSF